jgi:hypothetical protein
MDNSLSYADILKKTLQEATRAQPAFTGDPALPRL